MKTNIIQIVSTLLLVLVFYIPVYSINNNYTFKRLGIEDGLSQSTIYSMIQDNEGYMWFGTANGLNKYDGYNFQIFTNNPYDTNSISDNSITSLFEDKNGTLWIGTIKGILNRYNRSTNSFSRFYTRNIKTLTSRENEYYEYPLIFSRNDNNSITTIAEDNNNNLWLGTWGNGILIFNKKTKTNSQHYHKPKNPNSLSYNRIMRILIDKVGSIWIGTFGGGLNKVIINNNSNPKDNTTQLSFMHYKHNLSDIYSLSDNKITSLFEDSKGNIWIGTYNGGLNELPANEKNLSPKEVKFKIYKKDKNKRENIGSNSIMAILEDIQNCLWLGTFGNGLTKFNVTEDTFTHFEHNPLNSNSLSGNDVISLCEDSSGIIWAGTHLGEGITKLEMSKVKFGQIKNDPSNNNSLSDDVVWAIYQDINRNLWIGTYRGGLNKYDIKNNKFTHYFHNPDNTFSISNNHIRAVAEDKFGYFWIGTYSGGLNKFNPATGKFISFKHNPNDPSSIGANQIQDIFIDSSSNVWLATFTGGLNKFNASNIENNKIKFEHFINNPSDPHSLSDNRVYTLYQDREGVLWIGTFGGGLDKYIRKTDSFIHFKNDPKDNFSLSDNRVLSIFQDSYGTMWIGTYGGGLNKFDKKTGRFYRYKKKYGLNCDVVYGILEDNNKNLWLSSDNGIYRFNIVNDLITHYDLQDGLQSVEFSGGAYFKAKDGEMFFGGINGLNYFYPDSVKSNSFIPQVVITSIKVYNKLLTGERKKIILSHDENFISFEFAALDYTNPEDNHYAYKLEGLEKDWQYVDAKLRIASYTNLSPGQYKFIVKGSNSDRIWNKNGTSVIITILPPFWKTWWFISLCILVGGTIIYYFSTVRIKNLLAIERLKTKLAADLHDNIGAGLTEISILSELAEKRLNGKHEKNINDLKKISEKARLLVDSMSDIVWVVNPKKDTLYDLIARLKDSYSDFLESIGVRLKTSNLEKLENIKLPMDFKQNLYLIFKEGINNSIKHSHCKNIFLGTNVEGDKIEIKLQDDGSGFDIMSESMGNGIFNMRTRAELIGGSIKWEKNTGGGTTVLFSGKVNYTKKLNNFLSK